VPETRERLGGHPAPCRLKRTFRARDGARASSFQHPETRERLGLYGAVILPGKAQCAQEGALISGTRNVAVGWGLTQ
jgi:hypothetical protein